MKLQSLFTDLLTFQQLLLPSPEWSVFTSRC